MSDSEMAGTAVATRPARGTTPTTSATGSGGDGGGGWLVPMLVLMVGSFMAVLLDFRVLIERMFA